MNEAIATWQQKLDELVYALNDLTPEEIESGPAVQAQAGRSQLRSGGVREMK